MSQIYKKINFPRDVPVVILDSRIGVFKVWPNRMRAKLFDHKDRMFDSRYRQLFDNSENSKTYVSNTLQ